MVLSVLCIAASFGTVTLGREWHHVRSRPSTPMAAKTLPKSEAWLLVYIASSSCAASQAPTLPQDLARAVERLRSAATARGSGLSTLGVAVDWDVALGLRYLSKFVAFDEVAVGRNWANSAVRTYVWNVDSHAAAIPQIALVRQVWAVDSTTMAVKDEQVVTRILGPAAIQRWADTVRALPAWTPGPHTASLSAPIGTH